MVPIPNIFKKCIKYTQTRVDLTGELLQFLHMPEKRMVLTVQPSVKQTELTAHQLHDYPVFGLGDG